MEGIISATTGDRDQLDVLGNSKEVWAGSKLSDGTTMEHKVRDFSFCSEHPGVSLEALDQRSGMVEMYPGRLWRS